MLGRAFLSCMLFLTVCSIASAQETLYMAVLNSHSHRLNTADNPLVGLFVSTDRGDSWKHLGWREYTRTFYCEAGPDGTLWLACGNGVLRSTDGGASWKVTTGWEITEVLKVRPDPANASIVYAATAYGVFKSSDSGASWQRKGVGFPRRYAADVWVDRSDPRHLLAACEFGVVASADGGEHWGPTGLRGREATFVCQDPRDARLFWAGTQQGGAYRSTDGGVSWRPRAEGLADSTVYTVAIDPRDSRTMYAGTHRAGVYKSVDGGSHWIHCPSPIDQPVHALVVLPADPRRVYAGTLNGGLFMSTDAGATWRFNCQEGGQVYGLSVH